MRLIIFFSLIFFSCSTLNNGFDESHSAFLNLYFKNSYDHGYKYFRDNKKIGIYYVRLQMCKSKLVVKTLQGAEDDSEAYREVYELIKAIDSKLIDRSQFKNIQFILSIYCVEQEKQYRSDLIKFNEKIGNISEDLILPLIIYCKPSH